MSVSIAIIIPVHNRKEETLNCLKRLQDIIIENTVKLSVNIFIVDDGSTDGTSEAISSLYPKVSVLRGNGELWWTGAINLAIEAIVNGVVKYDFVHLLNDDMSFNKAFLIELVECSISNELAMVSSVKLSKKTNKVINAGCSIQGAFNDLYAHDVGKTYEEIKNSAVRECDVLTGASLLIPTVVFDKVGRLDELNFPHNWGDFEFTRRVSKSGVTCLVNFRSVVYTDDNDKYEKPYLMHSSRRDFVVNAFDSKKFFYGYGAIRKRSFMHNNQLAGAYKTLKGSVRLSFIILAKLILPNYLLRLLIL